MSLRSFLGSIYRGEEREDMSDIKSIGYLRKENDGAPLPCLMRCCILMANDPSRIGQPLWRKAPGQGYGGK
jgi:hypothetical protein